MRITNVEGWVNYDKSVFRDPRPLSDDDARLEEIYNALTPLSSLIAPDKFKSYAELKAKLNRVLCIEADEPVRPAAVAAAPVVEREEPVARPAVVVEEDDGDDDTLSFFQGLADED